MHNLHGIVPDLWESNRLALC